MIPLAMGSIAFGLGFPARHVLWYHCKTATTFPRFFGGNFECVDPLFLISEIAVISLMGTSWETVDGPIRTFPEEVGIQMTEVICEDETRNRENVAAV